MIINLLPSTSKRVSHNTNNLINLRIREKTISNINDQRNEENKISNRIKELESVLNKKFKMKNSF